MNAAQTMAMPRRQCPCSSRRRLAYVSVLSCFLMNSAGLAAEEAKDTIVTSHGISAFGDLKYAADFEHFDYVNPDAPKGGAISTWGFGTFDSLNP